MCILVGAAGHIPVEHNEQFYRIMSRAFAMAERGGRSAAGFSALRNNELIWEKAPMRSSAFVRSSSKWQDFRNNPPQLVICHGRGAMSDAADNINNHPHVGEHTSIVHEGWIHNHRKIAQQLELPLKGDCDSELIMQIIDAADDVVTGINQVLDNCTGGSLATAVIDTREPSNLFLARGNSGAVITVFKSDKFQCSVFTTRPGIFAGIEDFYEEAEVPAGSFMSLAKHGGDVETVEDFAIEDF
jgi:glucosamine 6-phosphate synthetase-like amidotransferase/phosphosugar isomerase protein